MSRYTLKVNINSKDLKLLIEAGYNFCLARDIQCNGETQQGNVVFAGVPANKLAPRLALSWEDKFQIFGADGFQAGSIVTAATDIASIAEGQHAVIDIYGNIRIAGSPQPGNIIRVTNEWRQGANIGVGAFVDGTETYNTFFISPSLPMTATVGFLPSQRYFAFFSMNLTVGTMFDPSRVSSFSFEFAGTHEITIGYADGKWCTFD